MTARPSDRRRLAGLALALAATPASGVDVWLTSGDRSRLLAQQTDVVFQPGNGSGGAALTVLPAQAFQTMEGFGAALTNSSAWVLQNRMNASQRERALGELFSTTDGIGLDYLRLAIGTSDFTAEGFYTYNDLPAGQTDAAQTRFSIARDRATILPTLDEIREVSPGVRLMASPWSAPGWMKTSGSVIGGSLATQWHASYSTYLRKFVEAYAAEGHPIDALTLQNEPNFTPTNYPGMLMPASQQIDLVKNHVGPEFAAAGLATKLLAYDHNWDDTQYPITVLNDPDARQYLAGTAFHGYAGSVSGQSTVRNAHPDKGIYFTEVTGGAFAPDFDQNLGWYAQNLLIGVPRNWGSTVLLWNLALDQNGDPHLGGCTNCRGVVTVDSGSGAATPNEEFFALGHASRFVRPGAVRVASTNLPGTVETVAFRNPDGSRVLLAYNPSGGTQAIRGLEAGEHFRYDLPARSLATFVWDADDRADFGNGGFEQGGYHTTGGSLDAWLAWGVTGGNVAPSDAQAIEGRHSLRLAQPSASGGFSGVSQGITVAAGDRLVIDAQVLLPDAGSIAGTGNSVLMKLEYYNAHAGQFQSTSFLGQTQEVVADGADPVGAWAPHRIDDVAPAGAVEARLVFVYSRAGTQDGAVFIDDVRFRIAEPLAGDFNRDGVVDAADYTVWRDDAGGVYTPADLEDWRGNLGASGPGGSSEPAAAPAVPEPTGLLPAFGGAMGGALFARRR